MNYPGVKTEPNLVYTITITLYPVFPVYFIGQFNMEVTLYLKIQLNHIVSKSLIVLRQLNSK
jgi:nitrate reductase NapE component